MPLLKQTLRNTEEHSTVRWSHTISKVTQHNQSFLLALTSSVRADNALVSWWCKQGQPPELLLLWNPFKHYQTHLFVQEL